METGLSGKVALITGAASGIGRGIAQALAAEGVRVVVADVDTARSEGAVAEIARAGGAARYVFCDVADEDSVKAAVDGVLANEGQLHVMVNNAGIGPQRAPLIHSETDDWDRVYSVNLRGVFLGIKHAARIMVTHRQGSIINIASVAGLAGSPTLGPYGATKAAVINLTQTAALELAPSGVRVNAICPGWIDTPILRDINRDTLARHIPVGRIGQPHDVAALAVYLASDAAAFVTGSAFRVDGGMQS